MLGDFADNSIVIRRDCYNPEKSWICEWVNLPCVLSVVFYQVLHFAGHFLHEYNLVVGIMIQRVFLLPSGKCDRKPPSKSFICMVVCHKYFC